MRPIIFKLLFWSGLGPLLIVISQWRKRVPVFLFHRVDPHFDPLTEPLSPDSFEKIIVFLKKFYRLERTSSLKRRKFNGTEALIQFDDATSDFVQYVHPILIKQNTPAALFIPTNPVNEKTTIWNYLLFGLILKSKTQTISIKANNTLFEIHKDSKYFYQQVMKLHSYLLQRPIDETLAIIHNHIKKFEKVNFAPLCNWADLSELKKSNLVEFGSHTLHHAYLPSQSEQQLEVELSGSKSQLEDTIAISCDMIAYPNGGYNDKVMQMAKQHYNVGFTVDESFVELSKLRDKEYFLRIPRFNVQDTCPEEIIFRIYGFHRFLIRIKKSILR